MDSEGAVADTFSRPSLARRLWGWLASPPRSAVAMDDRGVVLELSSLDMRVRFYEDRLAFHRHLGAKHGTVPYRDIRVARLVRASSLALKGPATSSFDASHRLATTMVITLESRVHPLTFDFREEPYESVREALGLIERGLASEPLA